jgi:hypothetical protein
MIVKSLPSKKQHGPILGVALGGFNFTAHYQSSYGEYPRNPTNKELRKKILTANSEPSSS